MKQSSYLVDRAALRWVLFARVVLGTLFLSSALGLSLSGLANMVTFRFTPVYLYAGAVYLSSLGFGYLLRSGRPGLMLILVNGLTAFDLAAVTGLAIFTGGAGSPFLFLYLFIIIGAAMLRLRRGALIMTALSMVCLGGVLLLEYHGHMPHAYLRQWLVARPSELLVTAFYNITAFYVVGILSSYLAERLRSADAEIDKRELDISILRGLQERIIDNVSSGLATTDEQGRVVLANRQAERILGRDAKYLWGRPITSIMPGIQLQEDAAGHRLDIAYQHPDGTPRFLGYSVSHIRLDPQRVGYIVLFQDLTRMRELETAVKRQEKLAALGSMAAGIAHEIRNPLGSISGSLQLLRQQSEVSGESQELLGIALREIDRLNGLVNDFLTYAKPLRKTSHPLHPAALFDDIVRTLANSPNTPESVAFVNRVPADLVLVADQHTLRQAMLNLVINAIQAGGKTVTLHGRQTADELLLEIEDDGSGMPKEVLSRLFEPFFTTRPDGVGLGLAIVYRIMEEYQGRIEVESRAGRTRVRLRFPQEIKAA